jgi:RNA polymerase sigma-70 factor (ECF subfamily)
LVDLEVIRRAVDGDADARQAVLEGCQGRALAVARGFTGDRDEAEDLAQEVLVKVYQSLSFLKEPERFWGWFETLAQRVCLGWRRRERRRELILGELCIEDEREDPSVAPDPFSGPEEALLEAERRQGIRRALRNIGAQGRKALEMFYLDGLSVQEIAGRLGVPENTVKQRLYLGRLGLREELITMPETAEERQGAVENPPLRFSLWGEKSSGDVPYNPFTLTRSLLTQQILIQIARAPKTEEEVAAAVGADRMYVADHLSELVKGELVKRLEGDRYVADFFILQKEEQESLHGLMRDVGRRDAEIIAGHIPEAREAFDRCPFEAQGFGWEDMRWVVVAVFLANLGVRRAHPEVYMIRPPVRPDGNRWFFSGQTRDVPKPKWVTGWNSSYDELGGVGHFWTPAIQKPWITVPDRRTRPVLYALADGPKDLKAVEDETGLEDVRTIAAEMVAAGYVAQEGDQLRLAVPAFTEAEDRTLCPVVDRICREVVERSRRPGLQGLDDLLDGLSFEGLRDQYPVMRAFVSSDISGYCLEALVEMGHLGTPPAEVSGTWACWAWKGEVGLISWDTQIRLRTFHKERLLWLPGPG